MSRLALVLVLAFSGCGCCHTHKADQEVRVLMWEYVGPVDEASFTDTLKPTLPAAPTEDDPKYQIETFPRWITLEELLIPSDENALDPDWWKGGRD